MCEDWQRDFVLGPHDHLINQCNFDRQFRQEDSYGTARISAMLKAVHRLGLGAVIITVLSLVYFVLMTQSVAKLVQPRSHNSSSLIHRNASLLQISQALNLVTTVVPSHTTSAKKNNTDVSINSKTVTQNVSRHLQKTTPVDVVELGRHFNGTWQQNDKAIAVLREELYNCCSTQDDFILTQKNTKIGMTIHYAIQKDRTYRVTSALTRMLPKTSPFSGRRFSRCSVVGNGAILSQSGCGQEIDRADYVFRCNLPPIGGKYAEDTGIKSNFTTANPISQISWIYKGLRTQQGRDKFMTDIKKFPGLLWVSAFGVKAATGISQQALRFVTQRRIRNPALVFGNPKHFINTMNYWKAHGLSNRLSTGMYMSSMALSVCDQVHLFGFWPFDKDPEDQPLAYHYYDKGKVDKVHNMPQEFLKLLEWHQQGIVNVHVHKCETGR
ncbi:alpha-2,8-sialyltransferase 8F-like [Branchiostoma floridae]|uniref:Alpha-2,8-sialyltransferase 8F-like n=1 Tax=Branchiostoma floridae TaxID=7739 RepID=A0A9J7MPB5_BRAFL|nr:alpha-2,8-sialyltransferase 8F-like [Branchiostoma floridae]